MEDKKPNAVYTIGSPFGMTLVFSNEQQLESVIEHLQGMLEWIHRENVPVPYIYHIGHEYITVEEIDKWTDWIKYLFAQSQDD